MKVFGVFDSDLILTLPVATSFLWAVGGTGANWIRRLGVPFIISLYMYGYQITLSLCFIQFLALVMVLYGQGYGDELKYKSGNMYYPIILMIALTWGLSQFVTPIYFKIWIPYVSLSILCAISFSMMKYLYDRFNLEWKIVEIVTGVLVSLPTALTIREVLY